MPLESITISYMSLAPHVIDTKKSPTCHSVAYKGWVIFFNGIQRINPKKNVFKTFTGRTRGSRLHAGSPVHTTTPMWPQWPDGFHFIFITRFLWLFSLFFSARSREVSCHCMGRGVRRRRRSGPLPTCPEMAVIETWQPDWKRRRGFRLRRPALSQIIQSCCFCFFSASKQCEKTVFFKLK